MSEENHQKVVAFLAGEFARAEGRSCVLVELAPQATGGVGRGEAIRTWNREDQPAVFDGKLSNVEGLTTQILNIAEDHAETYGQPGSYRFDVRTQQHMGRRLKVSFCVLVEGEEQGSVSDPPNQTGLTAQLMRHLEMKEKLQMAMVQTTIGTMSRMVNDFSEENRQLRQDRIRTQNEVEEARNRQNERDLEATVLLAADKRKDEAFSKIMALLPIAANRLLGDGDSGGPTPLAILANELANSLDQEQFLKIMGALKENQQLLLGEMIQTAKKAMAAEEKKAQPVAKTG